MSTSGVQLLLLYRALSVGPSTIRQKNQTVGYAWFPGHTRGNTLDGGQETKKTRIYTNEAGRRMRVYVGH